MIHLEQPPGNTPSELQAYLMRMFAQIDNILNKPLIIPASSVEIHKPVTGQVVRFTVAYPPVIPGPGVYFYDGTNWVHVV